ncbi:peptidyl-tRNA hydrolase 2, mitochondrial-like [Uloborus diversus]|uniref:peptidyl-tRNA hydrolase 2, mitochondrial-like n=1 Tax=Uloborus diversus TaxID=327109 RepID=UPI00240A4389|nr:peptidyl-tRNA hydrolase 2, mitochondrial-like [Uloborus diversus]
MGNIEKNLISSAVTNACAVACGIFLGYFLKGWLKRRQSSKSVDLNATMEEQSFSDLVQGDHKLVLVVQNGLKMGKGKVAAQCSHASVMAYKSCAKSKPEVLKKWLQSGQRKVVVKVDDEEMLLRVAVEARNSGLITSLVCDAGRTQIPSGSKTVLGVGPGPESKIDKITGNLKLL